MQFPGRSQYTQAIIDVLMRLGPGDEITNDGIATAIGSPNVDLRQKIISARAYLEKHHGIVFGVIRGVGLRRMAPGDIVESSRGIVSRISRQSKKGAHRLGCVSDAAALSPAQRSAHSIMGVIFEKIAQETKATEVRKKIEVARIDSRQRVIDMATPRR